MQKFIFILSFFFLCGASQSLNGQPPSGDEEMHYNLTMGFIKFGEAIVKTETDSMDQEKFINADVQTTGVIKFLYDAHYFYSANMDMETGLPDRANKILNEGKYHTENEVLFDRTSRADSCVVHSEVSGNKVLPKNVYDILTGFYKYIMDNRTGNHPLKGQWMVHTYFADESWDLKITYEGIEPINTIWGKIQCAKCSISTMKGHFFSTKNGLTIWFSDDTRYVPVKIRANMKIGSFVGNLTSYKQVGISSGI